jgi:hypothetical protein
MKMSKTSVVYVSIPGEGTLERGFRNRGEAIKFLEHNYGRDWRKLRPRFQRENNEATRLEDCYSTFE